MAYGLTGHWGKVVVIDTENHSADLYADLGNYHVLSLFLPILLPSAPVAIAPAIEANIRNTR